MAGGRESPGALAGRLASEWDAFPARNVVWIFGTARVGSTWVANMVGELAGGSVWEEPLVGELFGRFYYRRQKSRAAPGVILGDPHREVWLPLIRSFVLEGARARFAEAARKERRLVIKEPNGSIGAPILSAALPESGLVCLLRDPRDVVASTIDAYVEGGWRTGEAGRKGEANLGSNVRVVARKYAVFVGSSLEAYETHEGPKMLLRYEDLLRDPEAGMRRGLRALRIKADDAQIARVVAKYAWQSIPPQNKGSGKFYRKAKPGSWKEDLTPEQVGVVEEITSTFIERFYAT